MAAIVGQPLAAKLQQPTSYQLIRQLPFWQLANGRCRPAARSNSQPLPLPSANWAVAFWQQGNGSHQEHFETAPVGWLGSCQHLAAMQWQPVPCFKTVPVSQLGNHLHLAAMQWQPVPCSCQEHFKTIPISQSGSWYLVSKWFSSADQAAARCISQQWLPSHISQCIWRLGNDILCRTGAAAVQLTLGPRVVQGGWCRWLDVIRKQISATVEGFLGDLRWFGRS